MGVYEERGAMHWQQSERYISSYAGGGELSPVAPTTSPGSPRDCTSCRKREPPDETPQQPIDDACAGCGARITDRFYLLALERRWHTPCLRCNECKMPLDTEQRCYARDSNIFCKNDYLRLYGSKRCARCNTPIGASELVMRARDLVFHVHCFSCALCSTPLNKGDTFGIRDAAVYCRLHYETMPEYGPHMPLPGPPQMCPGPYPGPPPGAHYPPYPSPEFTRVDAEVPKGSYFNGAAAPPPRQKGRPRKKKPKDQDIMTANLDLNPEYLEMGFRGGGLGSTSRTKRMRTSFKHHQLRTMKSYFAINHNPDAKDLKQLSQKTGLPKRVLQNADEFHRFGHNNFAFVQCEEGVVPERAGEVAANGDKTGKQDGGKMFARRVAGNGHVSRSHGLHPVAAATQPTVQRHGRPPKPQLYGLSIAPALRFMSAVREPYVGYVALLLARWKQNGSLICRIRRLVLNIFNFRLTKTVIKVMAH